MQTTIQIKGIECGDANDALGRIDAEDPHDQRRAIGIGGKVLLVGPGEAHRLESLKVRFAFINESLMADGTHRLVTVPIND